MAEHQCPEFFLRKKSSYGLWQGRKRLRVVGVPKVGISPHQCQISTAWLIFHTVIERFGVEGILKTV